MHLGPCPFKTAQTQSPSTDEFHLTYKVSSHASGSTACSYSSRLSSLYGPICWQELSKSQWTLNCQFPLLKKDNPTVFMWLYWSQPHSHVLWWVEMESRQYSSHCYAYISLSRKLFFFPNQSLAISHHTYKLEMDNKLKTSHLSWCGGNISCPPKIYALLSWYEDVIGQWPSNH